MAINFPIALDTLTNPTGGQSLLAGDHSGQHANANDAIEALQAKVGVNSSADTNSIDYKLANHTHSYEAVGAAAGAVSSHEGAANPHPGYLTQAEGDALYDDAGSAASAVSAHELAADPHAQYALVDSAITAVSYTAGGTTTIALNGRTEHFTATAATGSTTWAITGAPANKSTGFILDLTNGGSQTQNWPAGSDFDGGIAPTLTAAGKDRLVFQYDGTAWAILLAAKDFK